MMVANRVSQRIRSSRSRARRALSYHWNGAPGRQGVHLSLVHRQDVCGVGAGELDLRFAFALPELLKDPDQWTAIYKGFSAWVAPLGQKGLLVEALGRPAGIESVYLSRDDDAFTFAVANVGAPRSRIPLSVELDERAAGSEVELIEPADGRRLAVLPSTEKDGRLEFELPSLKEETVAVVRLAEKSRS